jgi:hypothetical protein
MSISKRVAALSVLVFTVFSDLRQDLAPLLVSNLSAPALPYSIVANFLNVPPEANFGEVAAIAVGLGGHLYLGARKVTSRLVGAVEGDGLTAVSQLTQPEREYAGGPSLPVNSCARWLKFGKSRSLK